jgi:DedD protein
MARAISDEEQQLKRRARRRLIGAIVLVAAIVVVLPMVLDSEPKPSGQPVSVQIPSPDSGGFTSKVAPPSALPEPKAPPSPPPSAEAKTAVAAASVAQATAPVGDGGPAVAAETAKPAEKAAKPAEATTQKPPLKKAEPAAKSKDGRYVVQVIALADAGKARQMQEQITAAGVKSYTEVVKTSKGDVTRVRAGPFATRKAAERARDQLKKIGMNGNVTAR